MFGSVLSTITPAAYLQFALNSATFIQHTISGSQIGIATLLRTGRLEVRIPTEVRFLFFGAQQRSLDRLWGPLGVFSGHIFSSPRE